MLQLALALAAAVLASSPGQEARLPTSLDLEVIRAMTVQHDGRWPPLDTLARDAVESVTGEMRFQGHDPVLLLLAWTFDPQTWMHQPLIAIRNAELRAELQLSASQSVYSYSELLQHRPFREMIGALASVEGRKLDALESKVSSINEKLGQLQTVFGGQAISPIPDAEHALGAWRTIPATVGDTSEDQQSVRAAWRAAKDAFLADDGPGFTSACNQLVASLDALPAAHRPDPKRIDTELHYNRIDPFRTAWQVMLIGAGLAAGATVVRRRWFDGLSVAGLVAGFGMLSYGLWLRWQIAGRIPASNMFESLLFLSWGMGAFAIVSMLVLRHRTVPLTASGMGALALILADVLPLDHFIRPIPPVLMDTVWMSIHVPVIMVSYSVLALAVLIAHVQLITLAAAPRNGRLAETMDSLHYWYVLVGSILLLAGIITGSMWAASSWGRYWGWDPKEVWSLVAFLAYMVILHVRADHDRTPRWAYVLAACLTIAMFMLVIPRLAPMTGGKLAALGGTGGVMMFFVLARGRLATAIKSILAFWLIIMTYVGVNYVLGSGLHSYGFGTGAVARYMLLIGSMDLGMVVVLSLVAVARRPASPPSGLVMLAPSSA